MGSLRYLFVDMNSYFASVEQQERPELRGRPIGIVPSMVETTCCIAASYEAKRAGVKTGTSVHQARGLCPSIQFIEARPPLYVQYHHRILDVAEQVVHVEQVCSIDEFYSKLIGRECLTSNAVDLAWKIKGYLREQVGACLRCSVGIAPSVWLAKVATDMEKPDGLSVILPEDIPHLLFSLDLKDLPGIGRRMEARLHAHGIQTVRQLWALNLRQLQAIWGSRVWAETWWHHLRGHDLPPKPTFRRMVGQSHVLAPSLRHPAGVRAVLIRLLHKAAARLRKLRYRADLLTIGVEHLDRPPWSGQTRLGCVSDTFSILQGFQRIWPAWPGGAPLRAAVTLSHLISQAGATLPLFRYQQNLDRLAEIMDRLNLKYGRYIVYFGGMFGSDQAAPTRISFTQIPDQEDFGDSTGKTLILRAHNPAQP
ncbi:MAG: DNA polymerase [Phycisphaerales bacterium]|nr:DNA polymerase [Phycisphaerales bacterium]